MSEPASDAAAPGLPRLELAPLAPSALPPAVQALLGGPVPARLMAAKGIAPLRPADLLVALYQLGFDADAGVKAAAEAAPGALPDRVLAGPLADPLPAPVIHFFALRLPPARVEPLEKILYNQATADETFVALATRLAERELEVIAQNEARLLRCPAIVQALYFNKQARMSSVNRAIELLARNGRKVDGIPGFEEIAKAILGDPTATDPAVADGGFASVIAATEGATLEPEPEPAPAPALAAAAPAAAAPAAASSPRPRPPPGGGKPQGPVDFHKLKIFEKIRLAALGNAYCRMHLVTDPNRVVALAAIRSPLITESEIVQASGIKGVSEDVIRYIANQREFMKVYQVKVNLVNHPKCPLASSLRFLTQLQAEDLKKLARSKNVPTALATAAQKLVQTRGSGGK